MDSEKAISKLLFVMDRLRDPKEGCPWDLAQNYETIAPHTIEEAYEVYDAVTRGDKCHLKNELGDLLFQVVFYSQLATEEHVFTFADVVLAITEKMIRRHPHVFDPNNSKVPETPEVQTKHWEAVKAKELSILQSNCVNL